MFELAGKDSFNFPFSELVVGMECKSLMWPAGVFRCPITAELVGCSLPLLERGGPEGRNLRLVEELLGPEGRIFTLVVELAGAESWWAFSICSNSTACAGFVTCLQQGRYRLPNNFVLNRIMYQFMLINAEPRFTWV